VTSALPDPVPAGGGDDGYVEQLRTLLETAHGLWSHPDERRRMRYFGFRPAVEPGVLKREWHGLGVRISGGGLRIARPGAAEIVYRADDRSLLLDGGPFVATPEGTEVVRQAMDLVQAYERWVEAREGRQERISRGQGDDDRRPRNALAETRRLQRIMQMQRPRGRG
jgi:hypothetical protein